MNDMLTLLSETKKEGERTPPSTRIWTAEEVNLLKELNELYKNHRFPNVEISKIEEQIKKRGKRLK